MIKIISHEGNLSAYNRIATHALRIKKGIKLAYNDIGVAHTKQLKRDLNDKGAKTGRLYEVMVKGRLKRHRASARGQTPATLTGLYERNIQTDVSGGNELKFGIGNKVQYSERLELASGLFRPGLKNTIKKEERNTETYFEMCIDKALKE